VPNGRAYCINGCEVSGLGELEESSRRERRVGRYYGRSVDGLGSSSVEYRASRWSTWRAGVAACRGIEMPDGGP
jgi:hypothetical protein